MFLYFAWNRQNISIRGWKSFMLNQFFKLTISMTIFDAVLLAFVSWWELSDCILFRLLISYFYFPVSLKYQNTTYKGKRSRITLSKTYPTNSFPASRSKSKIKSTTKTQQNTKQKDLRFCKCPITFSSNSTFMPKES